MNISASPCACSSYAVSVLPCVARTEDLDRHVRALERDLQTEDRVLLGRRPRPACLRAPRRSIARVYLSFMRSPMPYGPPVQPVFTSHTREPCFVSFSPRSREYVSGGSGRNGAPKHTENVASGSVTPRSVPATFAV